MSITHYSEEIPGARGNYDWSVRFDKTDGYLGILQKKDDGQMEQVLLSPRQVKALHSFYEAAQRDNKPTVKRSTPERAKKSASGQPVRRKSKY